MLDIFILSTLNIKEMGFESQSLKREFYNLFTFDYCIYYYAPIKMAECVNQIYSLLAIFI